MTDKEFTAKHKQIAAVGKALGHPARIAILEFLATRQDTAYFGTLEGIIPLSKATISQHLDELKDAGLINGEPEGTRMKYSINREVWQASQKLLGDFFADITYKRIY